LCCISPKLPGDKFPATRRTNRRPAVASIALPKSLVNSSSGDEVPHIFTRKSRLQPGQFLITSAKRLLQQYLPIATQRAAAPTRYESLSIRAITGLPCEAYVPFARLRLVMKPLTDARTSVRLRFVRTAPDIGQKLHGFPGYGGPKRFATEES
jgi:hypothetical protein